MSRRASRPEVRQLDDAKALRAMGAPLNTPVQDGTFTPQAEKQIDAAYAAANR